MLKRLTSRSSGKESPGGSPSPLCEHGVPLGGLAYASANDNDHYLPIQMPKSKSTPRSRPTPSLAQSYDKENSINRNSNHCQMPISKQELQLPPPPLNRLMLPRSQSHPSSPSSTEITTPNKRFHKLKSSLKEIQTKVKQRREHSSRRRNSKIDAADNNNNDEYSPSPYSKVQTLITTNKQFSHLSEITLFHSTSTFDTTIPSVSSSMSSSETANATGTSEAHAQTPTRIKPNNSKNSIIYSAASISSSARKCLNFDCLPPPPSSLRGRFPYHEICQRQRSQLLENKWFTLNDDPTVEESIECVFSHQLQDGSAIDFDDDDDDRDKDDNSLVSSNGSNGYTYDRVNNNNDWLKRNNHASWSKCENHHHHHHHHEFTSGKIEYVGVVNGIHETSHDYNHHLGKSEDIRTNASSDAGTACTDTGMKMKQNRQSLVVDCQQWQHQQSQMTKSLPNITKLERSSDHLFNKSPSPNDLQFTKLNDGHNRTSIDDTKSSTKAENRPNTNNNIRSLPALNSEQWPQSPLLLRPSPGSGTRIRGVRFANDPNCYLMDASMNTMWWNELQNIWFPERNKAQTRYDHHTHSAYTASFILPINNGNEKKGQELVIDFESDLFEGTLQLRIRRANGTTKKAYDDTFGFFHGKNRHYQCLVSGRFKKEGIPMTECVTGQIFDGPLSTPAPYITKGAIKLVSFFAPRLQANLTGNHPIAISPLGSTPQTIQVDDFDHGHDEEFKATGTTLGTQEEPFSPSRQLIPLSNKLTGPSSTSMSRAKARKKAFDKLCGAEDKSHTFRTDKIYTFEFLQHLVNFDTLEMNLGSMLGKYKLNQMMNDQPLKIMAAHQKSPSYNELGDKEILDFKTLWSFDLWHESIRPQLSLDTNL